jgi:hypothetical protein
MKYCYLLLSSIFFLFIAQANAQNSFDFYISNAGNDANTGTLEAPKKTLTGVAAAIANSAPLTGPLKIGFRSGDRFDESYEPGYPVMAGTYFPNGASKKFAVLNGAKMFDNGWVRTDSTVNMYHQDIPLTGFNNYGINAIGSYSFVYVFEIDRQQELTAPVAAKRLLKFINTKNGADITPGSFYEPVYGLLNNIRIYIHPSNNLSPNNNPRYRYEVSVTDRAINSTFQQNNHFERLWITGYGGGNGMIPAGAGTTFDRMIFGPGAAIHHLGLRGASISNSLFLPGPQNTNGYAVVFYDVEGYRRHNTIRNSIFLDIKLPIYAHVSNGSRFGAIELDNVIAFANPAEPVSFFQCADTDSALLNNVYSDGYGYGYQSDIPQAVIRNSIFRNCQVGISFLLGNTAASVYNTLISFTGSNPVGIAITSKTRLSLSNSILHCKEPQLNSVVNRPNGTMLFNIASPGNHTVAMGNIFVSEVNPANYVIAGNGDVTTGPDRKTDVWDNNVYVLASGSKMAWRITGNGATPYEVYSLQEWKIITGQDKHSLFFDVRNDPRGLKAIFTDPDNGDYSPANTGNMIKALRAGMTKPVSCFLNRPTYDEAAAIIMNDGVLTANACRKPCQQNNIRLGHHLATSLAEKKKIQLQWDIEDEGAIDHFEIVRSFGINDFVTIGSIPADGRTSYTFTDNKALPGITYRYSLVVVTQLKEKCYSEVSTITTAEDKAVNVFPNPSTGKIMLGLNAYAGPVKVIIYDAMGRTVYSKDIISYYGIPPQIDLSSLAKGYYCAKVEAGANSAAQFFFLQ